MPENKLNDEKVLQMFVDRLIADKGGDTLDAKQKETLQKELLEDLDERIQQAMIRTLPDAKLMELEGLLDADASDEKIESFFKDAGVEFDPAIRKAMDEFRTDYFKDKIKVSVKTSILEAAKAPVAPVAAPAPKVEAASEIKAPVPAAGQPTQGTTSVTPGQSNVEGVANTANAALQGQALTVQPQVVAQGANVTSNAVSGASAVASANTASAGAESSVNTAVEQPLQAAPNLMDALSAAPTETAAAATAPAPAIVAVETPAAATAPAPAAPSVASSAMPEITPLTPLASATSATPTVPVISAPATQGADMGANTNMNADASRTNNTEMTGKEA